MIITKDTLKQLIKEELMKEAGYAIGGLGTGGQGPSMKADPHTQALKDLEDYVINNYGKDDVLVELVQKARELTDEFEEDMQDKMMQLEYGDGE
jgi:hypothetical protein